MPTSPEPADAGPTFDDLYREARPRLIRLAWLLVGTRGVAEEVVQDAFLAVHQRWSSLDNPGGYLRRAVVNGCLSWRRRSAREQRSLARLGEPPPTGDPAVDAMWDAIGRLGPERRAVVVLRYWADRPHREIAAILDCPDHS